MKVLVIEDEPSLREIIVKALEADRYIVETAQNYSTGIEKVQQYDYDCILLDIMLPDGNGIELLEEIKKLRKNENVIIISAKDSIEDKILGLEQGADDYLAKPFHLAELSARIKTVIRRKQHHGDIDIRFSNIKIIPEKFAVYVNEENIDLNRKEYDILNYFIARPNKLVDKTVLAESVWGDHIDQVDNFDFIYAQIKNLRKKLQDAKANAQIKAVYGFGYKLVEEDYS